MTASRSSLLRFGLQWGLIFAGLLFSLWAVTQDRQASQFILLVVLHLIGQNFSVPLGRLQVNLLPLIGVVAVLVLGWPGVGGVTLVGLVLAELMFPLWRPLWQRANFQGWPLAVRLSQGVIHLAAASLSAVLFTQFGGLIPLTASQLPDAAAPLIWLTLGYVGLAFALTALYHAWLSRSLTAFWREEGLTFLAYALLCQPFALIGALIFTDLGLLPFTIFCVAVGVFAQITWLSWQRRFILQQQINQFAAINQVGDSLRETLDPSTVLDRTYQQVQKLLPVDMFAIALIDGSGNWAEPLRITQSAHTPHPPDHYAPDGFVQWVAARGRVLDLDRETMPFAGQHGINPPQPLPAYWLGFPLKTAERVIGVMSLQRFDPEQPFSRWNREVLSALAGQVSASIENARLHSETVRLYNLTDEALARRLEQLQALLDSTHEGVLMLDGRGRVALVNQLAAQLLGYAPDTLHDEPLLPQRDAAALGYTPQQWQHHLVELLSGQATLSQRTLFTRPAGGWGKEQPLHLERNEGPVLATNGQVMGWLMVFRDVTEEQERAAWRTELTRMIVHDLRNPVTTLLSTLHLLNDQLPETGSPEGTAELVETARLSCMNLLDMIDSLMDINRMEAGQLIADEDALALPPLVERVMTHVRPLALRKQITLRLICAPDLPFVWADEDIIRRVWLNLLDNALKFTPAGGVITVQLQPEPPLTPHDEPGVRGMVQDTGPGVPAEYQERIFDRFVQINRGGAQVRGTGLGLTFCKLALEAHRGRIWVEDAAAGGSCFVFTLPGIPIVA
ncbi:MAG: GAF domain-containing protein [Chloroflexi bacterium]|nr:GAF domain-containing protein [Chloroflexota bacterium]